jgi:hypothetical protein
MTIIIMMEVKTIPVLVLTPVQTMKKGEEEEEEEEEETRKEMIEEIIGDLIEIDQTEIIIEINFLFI